ncbi:MAG: large conductance mechanosensitive channel protein MscL [Anaerolineaceae bacterium]
MKKLVNDFRDFLVKGNALNLAVGVIIGSAFGSVVNGLVNDVIMPPIGLLLGNVNFSDLYIQLNKHAVQLPPKTTLVAALERGAVVLAYGNFLTTVINFVIVAFCIFLMIRGLKQVKEAAEKLGKHEEATAAEPIEKTCPFCQTDIPLKAIRCPHCTSQLEQ